MNKLLAHVMSLVLTGTAFGQSCPDCVRPQPTMPPVHSTGISKENPLVQKPYTSICRVSSRNSGTLVSCSGTLIGRGETGGLILTAAHCVPKGAKQMYAQWDYQPEVVHQGQLLAINRQADLAVFSIPDPPCGAVQLAEPSADNGPFTAVGFPGVGRGRMYFVQGKMLGVSDSGRFEMSHSIAPGFSGGPIFDKHGRLVALGNFRSPGQSSGPSFIQIAEFLEPFLPQDEEMCALLRRWRERRRGGGGGGIRRPDPGDITPINPDNAPKFDIDLGEGGVPETPPATPDTPDTPDTPPDATGPITVPIPTSDLVARIEELERIVAELKLAHGDPGPRGPPGIPGPAGPQGPAGSSATIDAAALAKQLPPFWIRVVDPRGTYTTEPQKVYLGQQVDLRLEPIASGGK